VAAGASGTCRAEEGSARIGDEQKWHWGSCAKALSATVLASLVDAGQFEQGWDSPLGSILDSNTLPPDCDLAAVTLQQLASHRGGVRVDLELAEEEELRKACAEMPVAEQRKAFVRKLAEKPLEHAPGKGYGYSNAGFVVLSAAAEASAKQPWEDLVVSRVTEPLGMTSFGFGSPPPGEGGAVGHNEEGEVDETGDAVWNHGCFSVHSSLSDWARFARLHLRVLRGEGDALAALGVGPASAQVLQMPLSPAAVGEACHGPKMPLSMAMGWQCLWEETEEGQSVPAASTGVLWHFGTNFRFNSGVYLRADPPLLMLAGFNSGSMLARLGMRMAFEATIAASVV